MSPLKNTNMKKALFLVIVLVSVLIAMTYVSCNNNPEPDYTGAAKKDTVVVKDSVTVKRLKSKRMIDPVTIPRIAVLHPKLRAEAGLIYGEIDCAIKNATCRFTQTLRTIDEQNALYAQGRTKPGPIVTNAKGGLSYHNYGLAIDFAFIVNGKLSYDMKADSDKDSKADWMEVVAIFKQFSYEWGGDWHFKDYPHFQKTFGHSVRDLLALYHGGKVDKDNYVLI
jgi:peptidoglycan L-alanyl-D-glutamate endopeptidase CwlK